MTTFSKNQKGIPMTTLIFETDTANFQFDLPNVKEIPARHSLVDQGGEAKKILEILTSAEKGNEKVPIDNEFFAYLVLDLLSRGTGSVFCKSCHKTHQAIQLQFFPLGFGESAFTVNSGKKGGCLKRTFAPKIKGSNHSLTRG